MVTDVNNTAPRIGKLLRVGLKNSHKKETWVIVGGDGYELILMTIVKYRHIQPLCCTPKTNTCQLYLIKLEQ